MKNRLARAWGTLLLLPPLALGMGLAQAQPGAGPGAGARGGGPGAGWNHGWGMMGDWGMMGGPGTAGGWGGMMGGPGTAGGWGMMGQGWGALSLSKDQRNKIYAIHRELREKQFALMDRMHDSMQSVNVYRGGKFDEQAARNAYAAAEKVHRQMFDNMLDAQKRVDAVLTPQQRQQLSQANQ